MRTSPSNLTVNGSNYSGGCFLSASWTAGNEAQYYSVYVNGQPYKDGSSHYQYWPALTGILMEAAIVGALTAGKTFDVVVRAFYSLNPDGTSINTSDYLDSNVVHYVVPSAFSCAAMKQGKKH